MRVGEHTWWAGVPAVVTGHRNGRPVLRLDDGSTIVAGPFDARLGARTRDEVQRQGDNLARLAEAVLDRLARPSSDTE